MKIMALDLGKNKSVGCAYEAASGVHEFMTIPTTAAAIHDLLVERQPDRVVFEVGPSAGWIGDLVKALDIELQVANPSHEGWRWRSVKKKSDRVDALKMARLSAVNQLPTVRLPSNQVREWRTLIRYRQSLVQRRTMIKNNIRSLLEREGLTLLAGKNGWSQKQLKKLQERALPLEQATDQDLWRGELYEELQHLQDIQQSINRAEDRLDRLAAADPRVQLLRSVPGVGPRLSEVIVAVIDDPRRFTTGRQVASYAGLTPRQYQSGSTDRQGRISKQGNRTLRSLLVEASWLGLRYNPWMKQVFEQVCRGSKTRRKIAIVAVARRLLIRCWAMMRDGQNWRPTMAKAA